VCKISLAHGQVPAGLFCTRAWNVIKWPCTACAAKAPRAGKGAIAMFLIGNHVSSSKGYLAMGRQAARLGGNTFAFFTRNPRGGAQKPLDEADAAALRGFLRENGFGTLVAHAPYTLNACGKDEAVRDFAHRAMEEDIARLEAALPGQYYNFHPGSHVGQGAAEGVRLIAAQLNAILTPGMTTTVLLETMAGKGSEVGRTFEELAAILDKVQLNEKVAVCLDTCHVWDGGYDIVRDLDGVLAQFDRVIGLEKLKALHVNDSLNPCGAHKDRHAQIGEGHIGAAAFARIAQHPVLAGLPKILETPNDDAGWAREIAFFKAAAAGGAPQKPHGQAEG